MRIRLIAVPSGGGEAEYSLDMEVPAVPRVGEYITVMRQYQNDELPTPDHLGTEDFIVRRVRWGFTWPDDGNHYAEQGQGPVGEVDIIAVECEMAIGAYSSKAHRQSAGASAMEHESSAY